MLYAIGRWVKPFLVESWAGGILGSSPGPLSGRERPRKEADEL